MLVKDKLEIYEARLPPTADGRRARERSNVFMKMNNSIFTWYHMAPHEEELLPKRNFSTSEFEFV